MNMKYALCGIAIAAFVAPAFAASAFYVVHDSATMKCSIVEAKPMTGSAKLVGSTVYKTRAEAETGMKAEGICAPK
jgi:uncharacterized protein YcfJ